MTEIRLSNLGKDFASFTALADMNMTIADGEFMALLGPSGCGKSTTMNMIAGMLEPTTGSIEFDGRDVRGVPMARRGVGFVFQNYAIFTHMTVWDNLAYGLKARGTPRAEVARRVEETASLLQLSPLLKRRASGLSVNILQRLAIGRSAIVEPAIFLLDEPLSNVDAAFRAVMRTELKQLQRQFKQTMIYVTHDQLEAMTMADRIAVMDHGKLLQVGTPLDVYNNPENTFVAGFLGSPGMNLMEGHIRRDGSSAAVDFGSHGSFAVSDPAIETAAAKSGGRVLFGFRPEAAAPSQDGALRFPVNFIERIGSRTIVHLGDPDNAIKIIVANQTELPRVGEVLSLDITEGSERFFEIESGHAVGRQSDGLH